MRIFLTVAVFLALPIFPAQAASHDGRWAIEFDTQVGSCEPAFGWPFEVAEGRVAGAEGAEARGFIAPDGLTSLVFVSGKNVFRAQGEIKPAGGSGAWSSNTAYCGGRWKLMKR
jgi:hypothetical protein